MLKLDLFCDGDYTSAEEHKPYILLGLLDSLEELELKNPSIGEFLKSCKTTRS